MSVDRCFTVMQLAQRWRCRPSKVRKLIKANALAGFVLPGKQGRVLIAPETVAAYEKGACVVSAKPRRAKESRPADYVEYY